MVKRKSARVILRDNIEGIKRPEIRRLARRSGVQRISGNIYEETRSVLKSYLDEIVQKSTIFTEHAGRVTVTPMDVVNALKATEGKQLYGFSDTRKSVSRTAPKKKTSSANKPTVGPKKPPTDKHSAEKLPSHPKLADYIEKNEQRREKSKPTNKRSAKVKPPVVPRPTQREIEAIARKNTIATINARFDNTKAAYFFDAIDHKRVTGAHKNLFETALAKITSRGGQLYWENDAKSKKLREQIYTEYNDVCRYGYEKGTGKMSDRFMVHGDVVGSGEMFDLLTGKTNKLTSENTVYLLNKKEASLDIDLTLAKAGEHYDPAKHNCRLLLAAEGEKLVGFVLLVDRSKVGGSFENEKSSNVYSHLSIKKRPNKLPNMAEDANNADIVRSAVTQGYEVKFICTRKDAAAPGTTLLSLLFLYCHAQDNNRPLILEMAREYATKSKVSEEKIKKYFADGDGDVNKLFDPSTSKPQEALVKFYSGFGFKYLSGKLAAGVGDKISGLYSNFVADTESLPMYREPFSDANLATLFARHK